MTPPPPGGSKSRPHRGGRAPVVPWTFLLLTFLLIARQSTAQQSLSVGTISNFQVPILGNDGKRTIVRGKEAEPIGNGFIRLVGARVESYGTNKGLDLLIEAPLAFYNQATRRAFSQDQLKVTAEGGKFAIEGTGFEWDPKENRLSISNSVRATIAQQLLSTNFSRRIDTDGRGSEPLIITSQSLGATPARADFTGNAEAILTDGKMTAEERLSIHFGETQREIRKLEGVGKVAIAREDLEMSGDRAEYSVVHGLEIIQVRGAGRWRKGDRRGTADLIEFQPARNIVSAIGNGHLEAPLFRGSVTNQAPASAPIALVDAESFSLQMSAPGAPGQSLEAHTNVVIRIPSEGSIARAQAAFYTDTNGLLRLLGDPVWTTPEWELGGAQIYINERAQTVHAWPNLRLKVLASAFGLERFFRSPPGAPQQDWLVEASSDLLFYSNDKMQFQTNVHVRVLEGQTERGWSKSDLLTIDFRPTAEGSRGSDSLPSLKAGSLDKVILLGNVTGEQLPWKRETGSIVSKKIRAEEAHFVFQPGPVIALDTITVWENAFLEQTAIRPGKTEPSVVSLAAERIAAKFFPQTNRVDTILATTNVVIKHSQGEGQGQRAIYSGTNDMVELTGNPTARMTGRGEIEKAGVMTWHRSRGLFGMRGGIAAEWTRTDTNAPARLP